MSAIDLRLDKEIVMKPGKKETVMKNKWIKTLAVTLVVVCMAGCGVKDAAGPLSEGVMAKEAESGQDLAEKVSAETKTASKGREDKCPDIFKPNYC